MNSNINNQYIMYFFSQESSYLDSFNYPGVCFSNFGTSLFNNNLLPNHFERNEFFFPQSSFYPLSIPNENILVQNYQQKNGTQGNEFENHNTEVINDNI